jgi:rare lipoprotein A (peptidoglycan hydrolase)
MVQYYKNILKASAKTLMLFLAITLLSACSSIVRFSSDTISSNIGKTKSQEEDIDLSGFSGRSYGKASYYGNEFESRKTANGEFYSGSKLTAAHRELPFGTYLKVTNRKNLKQVIVKVNDRGPFVSGRILDLSRSAAEQLDMLQDGIASVEIEIIGKE